MSGLRPRYVVCSVNTDQILGMTTQKVDIAYAGVATTAELTTTRLQKTTVTLTGASGT